jgi:DNA-binding winged helix-turn-helix (wHTH) protein/tetratricopeptide (TPR) repeat protein
VQHWIATAGAGRYIRPVRYKFAGFDLDSDAYKLTRGGCEIHLQPLVFDVLHYLIRHRDRIVSKEELLDALWEDGTGNDAAVTWSISHVRRALEQTRWQKAPIETLHGRGYRFVGDLIALDNAPPTLTPPPEPPVIEAPLPFVGRGEVMEQLQAQLNAAEHGTGNLTVLVGEAGIGKTRCASELARKAETRGFLVLNASSVEGVGAPVFHPWQQIVRGLAQVEQRLRQPANALLAQLSAALQGSLAARTPETVTSNRVRLFDAAVQLLLEAARLIPLLLLFDDLHWADAGSIELLSFAAPELLLGRCMVLGTRRDDAAAHNERALSGLARRGQHLPLSYLTSADVSRYIAEVAHQADPPPALSAAVLAASAGNPLFMQETVRTLLAGRTPDSLQTASPSLVQPSKVSRDVLRTPLTALDPPQLTLLSTASVLGETFELTLLKQVAGLEIDSLLDRLETARQLGIVLAEAPNRYKFRHALLRTILYDDMQPTERIAVHRRAAELLSRAADGDQRQREIAIHYYSSLAAGDPAAVTRATVGAAEAAEDLHAFEDAAMFYQWALEAQSQDGAADLRERADLLVRCGHAQRLAGREEDTRRTLETAIALASEHGFSDLLVKAAGILRPTPSLSTVPDELVQTALEHALETAPAGPHPQRIHALSQLACMPPIAVDLERSKEMTARALTLARERTALLERQAGRPQPPSAADLDSSYNPLSYARVHVVDGRSTLVEALRANLYSLSGPDDVESLLAVCDEILALDQPRTDVSWRAYMSRYAALLARGEMRAASNALEAAGHLGDELNLPEARWHYDRHQAQTLIAEGRFAEGRMAFKALRAKSVQMGLGYGPGLIDMLRGALEWEQRGGPAMRSHVDVWDNRSQLQGIPSVTAYSARLAVEAGAREIAERSFNRLARDGFADVPKEHSYLLTLSNAALTAIALGDRARAEILYELLAPYPEHNTPDLVLLHHGSVSRYLALLAAATGRNDRVAHHFEAALAMNARLPHLPQLARTQYEFARWLLVRGDAAARDHAGRLARQSRQLAQDVQMTWLQQTAQALVS